MVGPLHGVTIADFTTAHQGPWATQKLGDMGADVIKIERVDGEWSRNLTTGGGHDIDGTSPFWLSANRSKRSVALDLKAADGRAAALDIIAEADVLVENFRPGVMERLDLDYGAVRAVAPDIVYVSASGFGSDGPYADRPGQDLLMQALSGMTIASGRVDDPPTPVPFPVVDGHSAMHIVNYTLAALFHRERTGEGQRVEINLLNAAIDTQCQAFTVERNVDHEFERSEAGIAQKYLDAPYGLYETADGYIAIAMTPLEPLAEALDAPELADHEPPETFEERDDIKRRIEAHTACRPTEDLLKALLGADIWAAQVHSYEEAATDPQVQHNEMLIGVDHPHGGTFETTGIVGTLSESPPEVQRGPPAVGEHTEAVLCEVGYTDETVADLVERGVAGT